MFPNADEEAGMPVELDMVVGEVTADAMASERERNHRMYSPVMQLVTFIATAESWPMQCSC